MSRKARPSAVEIAALERVVVPQSEFRDLYVIVQDIYKREALRRGVYLIDQLAKNKQVTELLLQAARSRLHSTRKR